MSGPGLGKEYWKEVIGVLREIIPVYDKVNRVISLGNDTDFRLEGIRLHVFPGNLDTGCWFRIWKHVPINITGNKGSN